MARAKILHLAGGRTARINRVANAYENGFDSQVVVQQTIDHLRRRGQINEPQFMAAQVIQQSFEMTSAIGSVLDPSKSGGGGFGPRGKSFALLQAADKLKQARTLLGGLNYFIVEMIVGKGFSVEDCARKIYDNPSQRDIEKIGRDLRDQLTLCAAMWFGKWGAGHAKMVKAVLTTDAKPTEIRTGEFERQVAAAG